MAKYITETKLDPSNKQDLQRWEGIVSNLFDNYIRLYSFYCRIHDALDKGKSDPLPESPKSGLYRIYETLCWTSGCIVHSSHEDWLIDKTSSAGRALEFPDESAEVLTNQFISEWKKLLPGFNDKKYGLPLYDTDTVLQLLRAEHNLFEIYYFFEQLNIPLKKFHSFDLAPALMGIIGIHEKHAKKVRAIIDKMNENETQVFDVHLHEAYLELCKLRIEINTLERSDRFRMIK